MGRQSCLADASQMKAYTWGPKLLQKEITLARSLLQERCPIGQGLHSLDDNPSFIRYFLTVMTMNGQEFQQRHPD